MDEEEKNCLSDLISKVEIYRKTRNLANSPHNNIMGKKLSAARQFDKGFG